VYFVVILYKQLNRVITKQQ